jgi:hypothetical protein
MSTQLGKGLMDRWTVRGRLFEESTEELEGTLDNSGREIRQELKVSAEGPLCSYPNPASVYPDSLLCLEAQY